MSSYYAIECSPKKYYPTLHIFPSYQTRDHWVSGCNPIEVCDFFDNDFSLNELKRMPISRRQFLSISKHLKEIGHIEKPVLHDFLFKKRSAKSTSRKRRANCFSCTSKHIVPERYFGKLFVKQADRKRKVG